MISVYMTKNDLKPDFVNNFSRSSLNMLKKTRARQGLATDIDYADNMPLPSPYIVNNNNSTQITESPTFFRST